MNQSIHDQGLVTPALTINDTLLVASGSNVGVGTSDPKVPLDVFEMGGLYLGYTALAGSGTGGSEFTVTTTWTVIDIRRGQQHKRQVFVSRTVRQQHLQLSGEPVSAKVSSD